MFSCYVGGGDSAAWLLTASEGPAQRPARARAAAAPRGAAPSSSRSEPRSVPLEVQGGRGPSTRTGTSRGDEGALLCPCGGDSCFSVTGAELSRPPRGGEDAPAHGGAGRARLPPSAHAWPSEALGCAAAPEKPSAGVIPGPWTLDTAAGHSSVGHVRPRRAPRRASGSRAGGGSCPGADPAPRAGWGEHAGAAFRPGPPPTPPEQPWTRAGWASLAPGGPWWDTLLPPLSTDALPVL